jgi:flagellar basal-body rod modification protein FlgD
MSIAAAAAQQSQAAAASGSAGSSSSASATAGGAALTSLSSNFNDFLNLLMTQLKNQDPSSPMDANSFTSELVQFSSVEQQINTNSSLTQLIQLTQAEQVEQSAAILGKPVTVTSTQMPLVNGSGSIQFTAPAAEQVAIAVTNQSGVPVASAALTSASGVNTWTWNGQDGNGVTQPDGLYTVTVNGVNSSGSTSTLPFSVVGKATGVTNQAGNVELQLGALTVPFSSVQSVGN